MNQYEIELRDKVALRIFVDIRAHNGTQMGVFYDRDMIGESFGVAEEFMAERQKHLDAIKRTNYHGDVVSVEVRCLCGWVGQQHMLVDDKCPDCQAVFSPYPPRKVQGTE